MIDNEKTDIAHWDQAWSQRPRMRFPSGLDIGTRNVQRLLRPYLRQGMRYMEVGCAPGKNMAWVAREIQGVVSGIDYSPTGADTAKWLCDGLGVQADIRCEDAMQTSFESGSFDLVFSCGLVEHFEDPSPIITAHLKMLAPGGVAVIAVPNYRGLYLKLQQWCYSDNLAIHNLGMMSESGMLELVPDMPEFSARAFLYGHFSPWLVSLPARLGRFGLLVNWGLNFLAHLQPVDIRSLSPLVVLEVRRACV